MAYGNKTGGRKAGTPNKTTTSIKERISYLIDSNFEQIAEDMASLDPKDRILVYQRFVEYVLPKQREQKIDISSLSEEQVDELIDKALSKLGDDE